jgi:hypothetical protein
MFTIAGGIILAVIFMFIVLPLLGAMFGAIFEGIGSFFTDLLKLVPYLLGMAALSWSAYDFYFSADFRWGTVAVIALALAVYIASIRVRFTSFSEAFGYLRTRLRPTFSANAIVRKAEALKGYKAIEDRLRAEADKKRKDAADRRKEDAKRDMERHLENAAREYQAHLNIDIIKDRKRDSVILRVNKKPVFEIRYCEGGWALLDIEASTDWYDRCPPEPPYLTRSMVIDAARKTLKQELLNSINTAPDAPRKRIG